MSEDPYAVDEIRREIVSFVSDVVEKEEWKIIVPIMRKGLFLLVNTSNNYQEKIALPPFHGVTNLGEKMILILDDKAWHGHTMEENYNGILRMGGKAENVKTAVFMKHRSCSFPIDYYYYELDDLDYEQKEAALSEYYDSSCLQLDPDHLIAEGIVTSESLDPENLKCFPSVIKKTQDLGLFYFEESKANLWGIMKFAVADIPLSKLNLNDFRLILREEGVQKLRFCLEPNGQLFIMPIFCPEIHIDRKVCKKALSDRTRLCEQISLDVPETSNFCRDCLNLNLQIKALESLLPPLCRRLKNEGFVINLKSLKWPELEYKYYEIRSILRDSLRRVHKADEI